MRLDADDALFTRLDGVPLWRLMVSYREVWLKESILVRLFLFVSAFSAFFGCVYILFWYFWARFVGFQMVWSPNEKQ